MNNDPPPPVFDAAARTKLSHARNAVLHCKASWKELKASLGRNIVDTIDSSQSAELFQKLAESIDHMERTYEEVKKDQFLRPIAVDVRRERPPHAQPKIAKERSNFFGSTLGNLLSHYEGKFRRGKQRDPEANAMEKKMKKMIGRMTPTDGSIVVYAVDERGKRIGFHATEVNEKCHAVKIISSGNFECRVPWDGWNIESILELEIGPDDWKKREEEEREEKEEEERDRTAKRAKKAANKSWTDGPADAKEDISSKMASEFEKVSLRKKSVCEMVEETNEKQAFEKFTKMARERAKGNIDKYCGKDGKEGASVIALAMLLEWFEDFHATSRAEKKAGERDDEVEVDPRTCGVEVPKRYLPEYYKDSETKNTTYQDVLKQEAAKEEEEEEEEEGELKE